ncbi:hypothetical protein B0H11DRAFT_2122444 [Mycena galericulata]|nr:hypothetical protein B0H11DRAFT_2122444 [Mycena galericulata]
MLNPTPRSPDESFAEDIPAEIVAATGGSATVIRESWWGDAVNSTVTLPSQKGGVPSKEKKRRSSRMRISGIRDMLRALTKGGRTPPVPVSLASVSTESSSVLLVQHLHQHRQVATHVKDPQHRRAKTNAGPESVSIRSTRPLSPFDPPSLKTASTRRPSLAPAFRIGKGKTSPPSTATSCMPSVRSLVGVKVLATVRATNRRTGIVWRTLHPTWMRLPLPLGGVARPSRDVLRTCTAPS